MSPVVTRASTRWLAAHWDIAVATAYWAAPPPKSPKATNPDTTGPTGAAAVVDVDEDGVAGVVDVTGAAGFVFAVEAPPPQAAKTSATTVTVMDRRRIHSTLPENDPKELSRLPLPASKPGSGIQLGLDRRGCAQA